jgi:hypothetical protein
VRKMIALFLELAVPRSSQKTAFVVHMHATIVHNFQVTKIKAQKRTKWRETLPNTPSQR